MRKWFLMALMPFVMAACVGQKEDPEPEPGPGPVVPVDPDPKTDPEPEEGAPFFRRVLAMDFTGSWCQYCPNMERALEDARKERPGRFVSMAVHSSDNLAAAESDALATLFGVQSYPSMVFNWDAATRFNEQNASRMLDYLDGVLAQGDATCGLAVSTSVADAVLKVSVTLKASGAGTFSLVAALVEDGLITRQAGYGEGYVNNGVLRGFLDPGMEGTGTGPLEDGQEFAVELSAAAPEDPENFRLIVYALGGGTVQNAVSCGVNETIAYSYEESH